MHEILTREEAEAILAAPNIRYQGGIRARAILEALYRAGLRPSEVCNLRTNQVRLNGIEDSYLEVRNSKRGKSRNIPITPKLMVWLQHWAKVRPDSEYWFPTRTGQPMRTNDIRRIVKNAARQAGLDPTLVCPKMFRATFGTECIENPIFNIKEVSELLGHSSIATTEHYLHVRPGALSKKLRKVEMEATT